MEAPTLLRDLQPGQPFEGPGGFLPSSRVLGLRSAPDHGAARDPGDDRGVPVDPDRFAPVGMVFQVGRGWSQSGDGEPMIHPTGRITDITGSKRRIDLVPRPAARGLFFFLKWGTLLG